MELCLTYYFRNEGEACADWKSSSMTPENIHDTLLDRFQAFLGSFVAVSASSPATGVGAMVQEPVECLLAATATVRASPRSVAEAEQVTKAIDTIIENKRGSIFRVVMYNSDCPIADAITTRAQMCLIRAQAFDAKLLRAKNIGRCDRFPYPGPRSSGHNVCPCGSQRGR